MKVGSLFSGYGGLDLAVGGDLAWYSEIEPAACKVMEAHYPGVPNIGDITAVDWSQVEPVDVITGGYPCQPFSNAGKRKGTNDERHLWPYVRDALGAIRPAAAVLENVRGHLTLGFDVVLSDLADLGWSARWGVVRAADAGAPHNRARLFIVAYPGGRQLPRFAQRWGLSEFAQRRPDVADTQCNAGNERLGLSGVRRWTHQAEQTGVGYCEVATDANSPSGQAHDDGRQGSGDARRPQPVECGGQVATNPSGERHGGGQRPAGVGRVDRAYEGSARQRQRTRQESGAGSVENVADAISRNGQPSEGRLHTQFAHSDRGQRNVNWGDYLPAIHRWQSIIGRPAPAPTIQRAERDRLNPVFVEWMMGLPEGWVTGHGLSASQELKMLGNGVVPQQARLALQLLGGVA